MLPKTGIEFMLNTSADRMGGSDQQKGIPQPPLADSAMADDIVIDLPAVSAFVPRKLDLTDAMVSRITHRD